MRLWLLTLAVAYLLGSIPFGYLLVRIFRKEDIRATGSGNIGATNVARSGAKGLGILTLLLDLLKGFAAVKIAAHFAPGTPGFPSDLVYIDAHRALVQLDFSGAYAWDPSTPAPDHTSFAISSSATIGLTAVCQTTACAPHSAMHCSLSATW